jgi:hypothetical protein
MKVALKWCLRKAHKLNNVKLNLLYVSVCVGMFICYSIILLYLKQSTSVEIATGRTNSSSFGRDNAIDSSSILFSIYDLTSTPSTTLTSTTTTTTTTETSTVKTHRPKPELADGDQLEQNHITKPSVVNNNDQKPPSTSTTSKVPNELIVGCLRTLNRTCRINLNSCILDTGFTTTTNEKSTTRMYLNATNTLNGTSTTSTTTSTSTTTTVDKYFLEMSQLNCQYNYFYVYNTSTNSSIKRLEASLNSSVPCFKFLSDMQLETSLNSSCLKMNEFYGENNQLSIQSRNCSFVDSKRDSRFSCSLSMSCDFDDVTSWSYCYKQFDTTTTMQPVTFTTTTPTTTSTTSTTTTTTTTETTTSTTRPQNLIDLVDLTSRNIIEYYSKINNLQFFYLVLALAHLSVTFLYSMYLFVYLKTVFSFLCVICAQCMFYSFCLNQCLSLKTAQKVRKDVKNRANTSAISFKKIRDNSDEQADLVNNSEDSEDEINRIQLTENKMKETILNAEDHDSPRSAMFSEEDDDYDFSNRFNLSQTERFDSNRNINKSRVFKQLFVLFVIFINVGCLLINFLLFMNNYLVSRLTGEFFYQAELIDKSFYFSMIAGNVSVIIYLALVGRFTQNKEKLNRSRSSEPLPQQSSVLQGKEKHKIYRAMSFIFGNKRHLMLVLVFLTLFLLSISQLSSEHFSSNDVKLMIMKLNSLTPVESKQVNSTQIEKVKLNDQTIVIYGFVYPFLVSSLIPLLCNLIDENRRIFQVIRSRSNFIVILWFCVVCGTILQSVINNYFIYYVFRTQNFFIYTNIGCCLLFILLILVYFCLN